MFFSIFIILLILVVAYFHYLQGLFSSVLSATLAIFCAVAAVSYHETLVAMLAPTKFADYANAIAMVGIFSISYIVLRVLFDKLISGNVRFHPTLDKVGAGVMGLIAGIFGVGVFALAAQSLPFGPSVFGFSRFEIMGDRAVRVLDPKRGMNYDATITEEMKEDALDESKASSPLVPADELLVSFTNMLSEGCLSVEHPLNSIHPHFTTELFSNRIGFERGAKHTLCGFGGSGDQAALTDAYILLAANKADGELAAVRRSGTGSPTTQAIASQYPDGEKNLLLVLRFKFNINASDEDNFFRFGTASVRLAAPKRSDGPFENYYPIGTFEDSDFTAATVYTQHADDPMFMNLKQAGGDTADFVFQVPANDLVGKNPLPKNMAELASKGIRLAPGTFAEVKRFGRFDLSNREVQLPPDGFIKQDAPGVLRKPGLKTTTGNTLVVNGRKYYFVRGIASTQPITRKPVIAPKPPAENTGG